MNFSKYQLAIFDEIKRKSCNVAVNAVAGSGKTFTVVNGVKGIPTFYTVLMSAFGRDIAETLRSKNLPANTRVATYNAFGWEICRKYGPRRIRLDREKTELILRHRVLKDDKLFYQLKQSINRLVSLLKGRLIFSTDDAVSLIPDLLEHYNIDQPQYEDFSSVLAETYQRSITDLQLFDFDDQIFQVLLQDYRVPIFDYVFVDEFQDTNDMQARMMMKASHGGLFYSVGDPDQAIYGFRGATPDAFGKFVKEFNAKVLPLSICYRCPKAVVEEAKAIVPRIEAAPDAIDGTVDTVSTNEFKKRVKPGDFVLCRTVAPLVKRCLECIRNKIPAMVLGRDIGESIEWLIDKVGHLMMPIQEFFPKLQAHVDQQLAYYSSTGQNNAALALEDRYDTLISLMDGCQTVQDIKWNIRDIFKENGNGVKFMTCHKSKGLENETVWVLRPDLIPHPRSLGTEWMEEEEQRLKYVTITRSRKELFWVTKEAGEK